MSEKKRLIGEVCTDISLFLSLALGTSQNAASLI